MATDDPIRASDADREVVVATLREAFTAGRLTMDEFDERMASAYASKTWGDLRKLTIDLPSQPILGSDVPGRQLPPTAGLPHHPARSVLRPEEEPQPPTIPRRRGSPIGLLIPLAVWVLLVAHGVVGPGVIVIIIAIFALTTIVSSIRRR
ncbi:MAG TPA: DUF1707 domain-containing protein [Trebonia sp.]